MARVASFGTRAELMALFSAATLTGRKITAYTTQDAVATVGLGYVKALVQEARNTYPKVQCEVVLDCGGNPADAIAAMRNGFVSLRLNNDSNAYAAVKSIAQQHGVKLY